MDSLQAPEKESIQPILRTEEISKQFGVMKVFDKVSIEVYPEEILGIIGVSGIGKTTLLELMVGFQKSDLGRVSFRVGEAFSLQQGQAVFRSVIDEQDKFRTLFGFAAQEPSFYEALTVEENLAYFGSLYNLSKKTIKGNTDLLLRLVDLEENRKLPAANLSGGMQKRLDIACALIHNPKILFLDEPTADLDILLRKQMWDLVRKINEKGTTVVIASHSLDEIQTLCNRIALLHNQTIAWIGTMKDLREKFDQQQELYLQTESGKYSALLDHLKKKNLAITKSKIDGNSLVLFSSNAELLLHHAIHFLESNKEIVVDVELRPPALSDLFESMPNK